MKTKHTKGEWIIETESLLTTYHLRIEKMGMDHISFEEAEANAKLIAAAPKLLEALWELVDIVEDIRTGSYNTDSFTLQPAKEAIKKAIE